MSYQSELIQCAAVCLAAIQNCDQGSTELGDHEYLNILLQIVKNERLSQELKWGAQKHSPEKWMVILMEEVGEAAKDVLERNYL
jgi:hypothetical protein